MSCRRSSGSSAVTSYARFLTGADEKTVSREFHALSRQERHKLGGPEALTPADPEHVIHFLNNLQQQVRADKNLTDRNRAKLLARIKTAHTNATTGTELPNRNIFTAWQRLNDHLHEIGKARNTPPPTTPTEAATTRADLEAAHAELKAAQQQLRNSGHQGRQRMLNNIDRLRKKTRKLQAQYDITADGWKELQHAYRARGGADPELQKRYNAARKQRNTPHNTPTNPIEQTANNWQRAREAAQRADETYRTNPTPHTQQTAQNAHTHARKQRANYLRAIRENRRIYLLDNPERQISTTAWARTTDDTGDITRADMWAATEAGLLEQDHAAGLSPTAITARAEKRAAIRKSIKDLETNNQP
jgi:hypothetical protein